MAQHCRASFSRSFELKSGADMTRLHMLHSPVPESKTAHRQHSGAATNDHHGSFGLCSAFCFAAFDRSPQPLSIIRSFHRIKIPSGAGPDPNLGSLFLGTNTCTAGAVLSYLTSDTALMMIRSRHAVGRKLAFPAVARSAGHLPAVAARAVSCRHELPCAHSSSASESAPSVSCSTFDQSRQYNPSQVRSYSTSTSVSSSPFSGGIGDNPSSTPGTARKGSRKRKFIPRKAAVALTPKARNFFKSLLENVTSKQSDGDGKQSDDAIIGIQLTYSQSTTGEPRMVFGFSFLRASALHPNDEAVSLEVLEDGETPKPPAEALEDGLSKLYVHHDAALKVLGATLGVDEEQLVPILYDKEGNVMDPNA